jgi:ubiquitin-conjugating enzyme E2 I
MSSIAETRLMQERKAWRKCSPEGFFAKPCPARDNPKELDLYRWVCGIPGRAGTDWEGAILKVYLFFTPEYPTVPPKLQFDPPLFHVNVYPSGTVCLSILNPEEHWRPSVSVPEILLGVQDLLHAPNKDSPAQQEAFDMYTHSRIEYDRRVAEVVAANPASDFQARLKRESRDGTLQNASIVAPLPSNTPTFVVATSRTPSSRPAPPAPASLPTRALPVPTDEDSDVEFLPAPSAKRSNVAH